MKGARSFAVTAALFALAACTGADDDAPATTAEPFAATTSIPAPPAEAAGTVVCDVFDAEAVETVVGEPLAEPPRHDALAPTCSFFFAEDEIFVRLLTGDGPATDAAALFAGERDRSVGIGATAEPVPDLGDEAVRLTVARGEIVFLVRTGDRVLTVEGRGVDEEILHEMARQAVAGFRS